MKVINIEIIMGLLTPYLFRPGTEIALKETHPRNTYATGNSTGFKSKHSYQKLESDNATVKQV